MINKQSWVRRTAILLSVTLVTFATFPVSSLAEEKCGPQPEGNCIECGPHWSGWILDSCPAQNNTMGVNPTHECGPTDEPVAIPTVTAPTYTTGSKHKIGTFDCNSNVETNTASITFVVGNVYWDPPIPKEFKKADEPTFTSTAYVKVTCSDPLCTAPGKVAIGTCTWTVIDGAETKGSTEIDFAWITDTMEELMEVCTAGTGKCKHEAKTSLTLKIEKETQNWCCPEAPGGVGQKIKQSGELSCGWEGECTTPSYYPPFAPGFGVYLFVKMELGGTVEVSTESECGESPQYCVTPALSASVSGGIKVSFLDPALLTVSGAINGGLKIAGQICYTDAGGWNSSGVSFCYDDISLTGTITLVSIFNYTGTVTLIHGDCP